MNLKQNDKENYFIINKVIINKVELIELFGNQTPDAILMLQEGFVTHAWN